MRNGLRATEAVTSNDVSTGKTRGETNRLTVHPTRFELVTFGSVGQKILPLQGDFNSLPGKRLRQSTCDRIAPRQFHVFTMFLKLFKSVL